MNKVILTGRIANDLEIKTSNSGKSYLRFTLATKSGKDTDFINCLIFDKGAELLAQYTGKGGLISVSGRLHITSVEKEDGKKTTYTDVLISDFEFLQSKPTGSANKTSETPVKAPNKPIDEPVDNDYDVPFEM